MKKIIISLIIVFSAMSFCTCTQAQNKENESVPQNCNAVVYRLFPTTNMYTFIKLNTRNGQMWQVQYSTKIDTRFETYLSLLPLVDKEKEVNGRFTLYSTQNMWTFILLDQIDGKQWQVQWSQDSEERGIFPIR